MRRRAWTAARLLGAVLILAVLVRQLGSGPFLDGIRGLDGGTLLAAGAIGAGTTMCSVWRWRVVTRALGVGLALPAATAAYYRSQFLNSTLPGGVLGDLHRGARHGVDVGDLGLGVRAVVWERAAGQAVQVALALVLLAALPSPVQAAVPLVATGLAAAAAAVLIAGRSLAPHGPARTARAVRRAVDEIRQALLQPATWPAVLLSSLLVVAGVVGMFLLAARAAGLEAPPQQVLPLALVVLLAAAVPFNVAGWGPREGVAAWVFAAAGWGAGQGAAVATAFGVMTLVATLPGAVLLLVGRLRPLRRRIPVEDRAQAGVAAAVSAAADRPVRPVAPSRTRFDRGARACAAQPWGGD